MARTITIPKPKSIAMIGCVFHVLLATVVASCTIGLCTDTEGGPSCFVMN